MTLQLLWSLLRTIIWDVKVNYGCRSALRWMSPTCLNPFLLSIIPLFFLPKPFFSYLFAFFLYIINFLFIILCSVTFIIAQKCQVGVYKISRNIWKKKMETSGKNCLPAMHGKQKWNQEQNRKCPKHIAHGLPWCVNEKLAVQNIQLAFCALLCWEPLTPLTEVHLC